MKNRLVRWGCLMCACLLFGGCAAREPAPTAGVTLPPVNIRRAAPENDTDQQYKQSVLIYLPSLDGTRLIALPETVTVSAARSRARALCELLLTHPGTEDTQPFGTAENPLGLADTDAVEVSGNAATVSLGASALRLSHEELFTLGQALANTLCQFGDVDYVNVLIAGVQPGLNVASTLPAGSFQNNTREDLATLWARASAPRTSERRSFAATLHYPAPSGKGILSEARTLSFSASDLPGMAVTLLQALSAGADHLPGLPRCPDLRTMLRRDPTLNETGGLRRLQLNFKEDFNSALINAGITRSVMVASLVCTMTTFLPGLDGVEILIGNEQVTSLTPSGTYVGVGETLEFSEGLMRRRDFATFLLAQCTLYFANSQGKLVRVSRPVPFYEAFNARTLIDQLMLGPQPFDSVSGVSPVLPQGLREADLLGVAFGGNTLTLNFSTQLSALSQGMDGDQERIMIYSLVNTLCELPGVKKVSIFVMGEQPDTLAGSVFLPGDFMPNYNLIQ